MAVTGDPYWMPLPILTEDPTEASIDKWFHRSRFWADTNNATATTGAASGTIPAGTQGPGAVRIPFDPMTDERDHATTGSTIAPSVAINISGSAAGTSYSLAMQLFFGDATHDAPMIYREDIGGGEFQHYASVNVNGFCGATSGSGSALVTFSSNPFDLAHNDGSFGATIDGEPVTIFFQIDVTGDGAASISALAFTIVEYWPYAYTDDEPVWDTLSGERADPTRPPVS